MRKFEVPLILLSPFHALPERMDLLFTEKPDHIADPAFFVLSRNGAFAFDKKSKKPKTTD